MASSLNISLTDEMRSYVNSRASDNDLYATPSEYIRDLIRQDMENRKIIGHVMQGVGDIAEGRLSSRSMIEIGSE